SEKYLRKFFAKLSNNFPKDKKVYYIPGNHDHPQVTRQHDFIPKNFMVLHNKYKIIEDPDSRLRFIIIGFGGAKIGIYNNFAFSEQQIFESLKNLFEKTNSFRNDKEIKTILMTHDAPYNTKLDFNVVKKHVGSFSIRKIIEIYQPSLALSGHIHESPGIDKIGRSLLVNAGEGKYGRYAIIKIDENKINIKIQVLGNTSRICS
ncbi:MAG: metallophosphoesterase family protein, partial [Promethearchaeota archaeon]